MVKILEEISTWGEIVGIIIPLIIIIIYKPKDGENRPLVLYVITAFMLNLIIVAIAKNEGRYSFIPASNLLFYNIHSVVKVFFFGWYLSAFRSLKSSRLIKVLIPAFILFAIINFTVWQPIDAFSVRIANIEAILLLLFCSSFFISTIIDNSDTIWMNRPVFMVCASINFYAALNFFVFLFFNHLNKESENENNLLTILLIIFVFSYMILCVILAIAIRGSRKKNISVSLNPLTLHESV
jgi:hypothetical protein